MLYVREFHRTKTGNSEREYEDAFASDTTSGVFAIADGATESSFSDIWAKSLVTTFAENPPGFVTNDRDVMKSILQLARERWYASIDWNGLPWFQRNKALLGSYSTLLGLQIDGQDDRRRFRCMTIGDSCMFQISGSRMESFPFSDSSDMSNTPRLMWSGRGFAAGQGKDVDIPGIEVKYGKLRNGDIVLLATDALAKWILQRKTERPWAELSSHLDDFDAFIGGLISEGRIKNDDVTLVVISTV